MSKAIGKMIKKAREEKGLTQTEVGKALGYQNGQFVYMIETGVKTPLDVLGKLIVLLSLNEKQVMETLLSDYIRTAKQTLKQAKASV